MNSGWQIVRWVDGPACPHAGPDDDLARDWQMLRGKSVKVHWMSVEDVDWEGAEPCGCSDFFLVLHPDDDTLCGVACRRQLEMD